MLKAYPGKLHVSWWEFSEGEQPNGPASTKYRGNGAGTGAVELVSELGPAANLSKEEEVVSLVGKTKSAVQAWCDDGGGGKSGSGSGSMRSCEQNGRQHQQHHRQEQQEQQPQYEEQQQQQPAERVMPMKAEVAPGELLFSWRNWQFWRFQLGTTCGQASKRLEYQVSLVPGCSHSIAVPALDEPWRMAFFSCNGLDASDCAHTFKGMEGAGLALWQDVARRHEERPFHLLLGGGDQLYNDGVFKGPLLEGWDKTEDDKDTAAKASIPFSDAIADEVQEFYFSHYAAHWSQPSYAKLFACVPAFSVWDDHDIVDGWGSYHDVVQNSAIMQGLFRVAQLFYLLFQHHTTPDRLLLSGDGDGAGGSGASGAGPWCCTATNPSCTLLRLGASVALLAPDARSFRSQARMLPPGWFTSVSERLRALPSCVQHVMVLLGGPVVYPRLPVQDAMQKLDDLFTGDTLISVIMQKTGLSAKVNMRFGMLAHLDDVIDQWSARQHIRERDQLLEGLMALAEAEGLRFTVLSGDVHCAGYGMLHSRRGEGLAESDFGDMPVPSEAARAADPRFIPQIISSAIVNVPPPAPLLKLLCLAGRNPRPVLKGCVERMVPLFGPEDDVDSLVMGRRNWCEATLGGPRGHLTFSWRCERELGKGELLEKPFLLSFPAILLLLKTYNLHVITRFRVAFLRVDVFTVEVPPLRRGSCWQE
ncbi:hypothetical protein VOLCADRAFT_94690 [Volvox carteri f. nagariensis]|uniref:PhoD-like phosphatase domain-containing protein n=1 Tax=Volvox carteri f. nagariensis TaxID=3068 RepID=D8U5H0_VOLCA|nr:uncharacterized protein VOLCADRAFT_94690 [Volvox carteri f. nagariensis]EFJ45000.1 hypothetical protein VOLCADRAFT_94690 [Volvox carteri f. nagariensis]|eukprot:XP_002953971.1 hypothetical protein VOLCADRAFT_94690 [Volvox carteri f. nagariensis]